MVTFRECLQPIRRDCSVMIGPEIVILHGAASSKRGLRYRKAINSDEWYLSALQESRCVPHLLYHFR